MLSDKNAILQVIGSLMKQPSLLSEKDKYNLQPNDFESRFERYIFIAILNSYNNGAQTLSEIDIDNYLMEHKDQYLLFQQNNGISYLQDALDMSTPENFEYYYNRIKKFNCLKDLKKSGFDISEFYEENELNPKQFEINQRFETLKPKDIFDGLKRRIYKVEGEYVEGDASVTTDVSVGIDELLEKLKNSPDAGARFQGKYFNTVTRGARKGKYYIVSFPSGGGKTRLLLGEACYLAFPMRYSWETMEWKITGNSEKTLFIATEQTKEEIQTMMIAFLSDVDEQHILDGEYYAGEWERVVYAAKLLEKCPLYVEQLPDFSLKDIENAIKREQREHEVKYVFFDYIHSSMKILGEVSSKTGVKGLREDNILFMISIRLKDLCNEYGIFIMTATQLNGDWKTADTYDQNLLRGAKAIADKADVGMIMLEVDQDDIAALDEVIKSGGFERPSIKISIYKNRRGRWKNVLMWCKENRGTCKIEPMFVTNYQYELQSIEDLKIKIKPRPEASAF